MKMKYILLISLLIHITIAAEFKLMWHPDPEKDGLHAFDGLEDDRKHSHAGVKHIFVEKDHYRIDMHVQDRDGSDRQRNEIKGMRINGHVINMQKGETWKYTYSMFIPNTLKGTTSFTHIAQMKKPGEGTGPIYVMSLRRHGNDEHIEAKLFDANILIAETPLKPLYDKWIDVELEMHIDEYKGSVKWSLHDGGKTIVHGEKHNVPTFIGESVRPKWGIYRSLSDHQQLHDTHLLLKNFKAYKM